MENWQFNSVSFFYIIAICLSISIGFISRKKSTEKSGRIFSLLAFATSLWGLGYFLGFFSRDIAFRFIALRIEYLGSLASGYFWFLFVLSYTRRDKWITTKTKILLAVIPVFSFLQILFIHQHHFFYRSTSFTEINDFLIFQKKYGPGFYIASSYNYLLTISGILIVFSDIKKLSNIFRKQNLIVIVATFVMLLPNFLYISGNNPFYPYDPTPIAFAIAYIFFLFAMFNYQFLNIIPIAQNLVYQNLKNGVIVIDIQYRIVGMNVAAENILEKKIKDTFGQPVLNLFPGSESIISKHLARNETKTEITIGNELFFELHFNKLLDSAEKTIGHTILLYNITEQKRAYQSLEAFSSTVAHDLKSPVATILNLTSLINNETIDKQEQEKLIEHIISSAEKMSNIIDALLLLAKINDNKDIGCKIIDNATIVKEAVRRLADLIAEKNAQIIYPEKWVQVCGHPELIEEVWVNYISNAIKYGGEKPIVELKSILVGSMVKMCVTDNGNGLSEENQKKLFTEFTRLCPNKDKVEGHGLGLSIVKSIVTKLGGKVGIESEPGCGCTFYFTLPYSRN